MKSASNVSGKEGGQKMTLKCDLVTNTPDDLIRMALKGRYQKAHPVSADQMQQCASQYVLKAVGLRLYLTRGVPLCRFSVSYFIGSIMIELDVRARSGRGEGGGGDDCFSSRFRQALLFDIIRREGIDRA